MCLQCKMFDERIGKSVIWTDSGFRTYKVPGRLFNLIFSVENFQGDGFVRMTAVVLGRGYQATLGFRNTRGIELDLRLFRRKVV